MSVDLLPAYKYGISTTVEPVPLDTAPDYVKSREATRWHRPRHGYRYADDRVVYGYWCGSSASTGIGAGELPDGDDLCGTCEGRYVAQRDGELIFTPRSSLPPRICPASGRQDAEWIGTTRSFPCPACREDVTAPSVSHYFAGRHIIRHNPGPGLVDPCRVHGWFHLRMANGAIACACKEAS